MYVGFAIANIIIIIISIYSMQQMYNIRSQYDDVINKGVPELELIGDMNFRIASQEAYIRAHLLGTESAKGNRHKGVKRTIRPFSKRGYPQI